LRGEHSREGFASEGVEALEQIVDLLLELANLGRHVFEFFGLFEVVGAAVRGVEAGEVEVSASLAGGFAIAFYLSALAFVAKGGKFLELVSL
jgi:hypothetical protein